MSGSVKRTSVWVTAALLATALGSGAWWKQSRRVASIPTIALIPQTAGAMLWEVEHAGATAAAEKLMAIVENAIVAKAKNERTDIGSPRKCWL